MNQMPSTQPPRPEAIKVELSSPVDQQQSHNQFTSPSQNQPKPLSQSKTHHSIFTPIEGSVFTKLWGSGAGDSTPEQASASKNADKSPRSQSLDVGSIKRQQMNGMNGIASKSGGTPGPLAPIRTASTPTLTSIPSIPGPSRSNSLANNPERPRLKVQIPSDHSDEEKATAGTGAGGSTSSPSDPSRTPLLPHHRGTSKSLLTPIREPGTAGPVLPPPSPSAGGSSAYPLSAGASGPPNPFARPLPTNASSVTLSTSASNVPSTSNANRDLDTPVSALPSRFMHSDFLPSPSSFYNEWGFGRDNSAGPNGQGNNMLPSPLTFQTPVNAHGPSFRDGEPRSTSQDRASGGSGERSGSGERDSGNKRKVDEIATPVAPGAPGGTQADKSQGAERLTADVAGKRIKT
jgi:transcription factor RLM1